MSLPITPISINDVTVEARETSGTTHALSWVKEITKPEQRPASPNLDSVKGYTFYQQTSAGNCNNGNCATNCNCGNIQCTNCTITGPINCSNCDTQRWLQSGTNCEGNCTYNCSTAEVSYNCNCACACDCACDCAPGG